MAACWAGASSSGACALDQKRVGSRACCTSPPSLRALSLPACSVSCCHKVTAVNSGASSVMSSEMAAYKGGPSGSAGFADQIKKSQNGKQRRKDLQARDLVSAQDEDEGDAHLRKSRASPPKQNKKAAGGLETMGLPTHNRKRTGFDQWQDELKAGEDGHKVTNNEKEKARHGGLRRQRSNSLDGIAFTSTVGGRNFAKYTNNAINQGLGAQLSSIQDSSEDAFFARKRSFADPREREETVNQIRSILEKHTGDGQETERYHPERPRRMASHQKKHHNAHKHQQRRQDEPAALISRQSSGDWSKRLGGDKELASKLDFLRDKDRERGLRRAADKHLTKGDDARNSNTWSLRDEREVFNQALLF